ncbi:MAG: DnaB-like helicase C-terminal domain-containing protein [Balneolaceae bacterium]
MYKKCESLKDTGTERALLSGLITHGAKAFSDVDDLLVEKDFSLSFNSHLFSTIKSIVNNGGDDLGSFDIPIIQMTMKSLGYTDLEQQENLEYLVSLENCPFGIETMRKFAVQLKKLSIFRDLYSVHNSTLEYLSNLTGKEDLHSVLSYIEEKINEIASSTGHTSEYESLGNGVRELVKKISENHVTQVGVPSGFKRWDNAIGGGLRPNTVHVIGARPKVGKSFLAANMGINISGLNVPVLYLDTELTEEAQKLRALSIITHLYNTPVCLKDVETGEFSKDKKKSAAVNQAVEILEHMPFHYKNVTGLSLSEILSIVRRFVIKTVGINESGKANPCVVIYDYLKIQSAEEIERGLSEHQTIGFLMTSLHNFAVKYGISVVTFVQLNRDGIESETSNVISQSDRILWLCSSFSIFKNKDDCDINYGGSKEIGNKKIVVVDTRNGAGMEDNDFINIKAWIRPSVSEANGTGAIFEGPSAIEYKSVGNYESIN